jgi:hypothetical protein
MNENDIRVESYKLPSSFLPKDFSYPTPFIELVTWNSVNLVPWYILKRNDAVGMHGYLHTLYRRPIYIPFARRQDTDDVAAWTIQDPGKIHIVDIAEQPEWAITPVCKDFEAWMRVVFEDMLDFIHG